MASEQDLELLDDYLANRLDDNSRRAFEEKLNQDPELRTESELQQGFIEGIKKARVAELKSMMNNVPVSGIQADGTALASKLALWTVIIGVVGTGLYFYLRGGKENASQTMQEQVEKESIQSPDQNQPDEQTPVVTEEPSTVTKEPASPPSVEKSEPDVEKGKEPSIDVYDPTKEEAEPSNERVENASPKVNVNTQMEVTVDKANKKYSFHYQFNDGKLILYGPFEKNLYEILEFFSDDKRTLFLYYNDAYYLLRPDSEKLRPLNAIEDPALIHKLKEYRN